MTRALLLLALLPFGAFAAEPGRRRLAGLTVRSDDYEIQRGKDTIEKFRGNVAYRHRGREFFADWAERRHARDHWTARGNVRVVWKLEDGTLMQAEGHEAQHAGDLEEGWLKPKAGQQLKMLRKDPNQPEPDRAKGDILRWNATRSQAWLEGSVHTWGPSGLSWSNRADYFNDDRLLLLSGRRPVLVSGSRDWDGAVQADRIAAKDRPKTIEASGRVRGWMLFEDREKVLERL